MLRELGQVLGHPEQQSSSPYMVPSSNQRLHQQVGMQQYEHLTHSMRYFHVSLFEIAHRFEDGCVGYSIVPEFLLITGYDECRVSSLLVSLESYVQLVDEVCVFGYTIHFPGEEVDDLVRQSLAFTLADHVDRVVDCVVAALKEQLQCTLVLRRQSIKPMYRIT